MRRENDLGRDSMAGLLLRLATPTMPAQFVNVLYSIVDRMFIGHIAGAGSLALAGVGVCGPIVTLLPSFSMLVGLGGTPLMAMKLGAGQRDEAFALLSGGLNSFLIAQGRSGLGMGTVVVGAALMLTVTQCFSGQFVRLFSGDGEVLARSVDYIRLYTAAALCMAAQWAVVDMSTALGQAGLALFCSLFREGLFVTGILLFPLLFSAPAAFAAEPFCDVMASCLSGVLFLRFTPKLLDTRCKAA